MSVCNKVSNIIIKTKTRRRFSSIDSRSSTTLGALRCVRDNSTLSKEEDTSPLISVEIDEFDG
jgi:hypothetical protein